MYFYWFLREVSSEYNAHCILCIAHGTVWEADLYLPLEASLEIEINYLVTKHNET